MESANAQCEVMLDPGVATALPLPIVCESPFSVSMLNADVLVVEEVATHFSTSMKPRTSYSSQDCHIRLLC